MENYAKIKLRPSTFKTSQGFLKNHIKPQIGGIPLAELTSLDLQRFYKHLLDGGRVDRIEDVYKRQVQNNDVWKAHQRAYKKYFARTRKGTMSKLSLIHILCKHCQKVFLSSRSNSAFCSARCKNQYNVYKSRGKNKGKDGENND